jgi:hypothetical protein
MRSPAIPALTLDDAHRRMLDDLREGRPVRDRDFDRLFPEAIQKVSARFWTPVVVARKVARLLAEGDGPVLDVGAGVGKLVIIGGLTTSATFHGVEHRGALVDTGNAVIDAIGLPRARLSEGTLDDVDWDRYRAFYFCNPFEENLFPEARRLDASVPLTEARFEEETARVEDALDRAPKGTRVVTFHGLGARVPATYRLCPEQTRGTAFLRLWIKSEEGSAGGDGVFDGYIEGR